MLQSNQMNSPPKYPGLPIRSCDLATDFSLFLYIVRWLFLFPITLPKVPNTQVHITRSYNRNSFPARTSKEIKMPGAHITTQDFNVMGDTFPKDTSIPPFMVSTTRGFLPRQVSHTLFIILPGYLLYVLTIR